MIFLIKTNKIPFLRSYLLMLRTKLSGYLKTEFSEAAKASFQYPE